MGCSGRYSLRERRNLKINFAQTQRTSQRAYHTSSHINKISYVCVQFRRGVRSFAHRVNFGWCLKNFISSFAINISYNSKKHILEKKGRIGLEPFIKLPTLQKILYTAINNYTHILQYILLIVTKKAIFTERSTLFMLQIIVKDFQYTTCIKKYEQYGIFLCYGFL